MSTDFTGVKSGGEPRSDAGRMSMISAESA
jgi:hypothetical protein